MKLKDLFNEESVAGLAAAVGTQVPSFDQDGFLARVFDGAWQDLELKQRTRHITTVLHDLLVLDYRSALTVLRGALPHVTEDWFILMVFPDYVEVYGLDDWQASMPALEIFTQRMSAEFAIRPFIVRYPERTMAQMLAWAGHENAERAPPGQLRAAARACRGASACPPCRPIPRPSCPSSNGSRTTSPNRCAAAWPTTSTTSPRTTPSVVLDMLRRWQADSGDQDEIDWITSHALRTLVKQGDPQALELLGYSSDPAIAVRNMAVEPETVP